MKIQYCSDLHLEDQQNRNFLKANPLKVVGDILLLAGDIIPFSSFKKHQDFILWAADHYEHIYWLPGNYEYYFADITTRSGSFTEKIRSNLSLINNQVIQLSGVRLAFSTLWSQISQASAENVQRCMTDFRVIRFGGKRWNPEHFNELHRACVEFLTSVFEQKSDDKTVVVTHHVPTLLNYPEKYKNDLLKEAFAVELVDLILVGGADYWIYGHHHQNIPDFNIGNTCLTTNQIGHIFLKQYVGFQNDKSILIY